MITDESIDSCGFRMFELHEIAATMAMQVHPSGGEYVVRGNKRERMAQYGNAVTPPVMRLLVGRLLEVLGGGATFKDMFCGAGGSSIGATMAGGELVLGLNHWRRAIETHAENFPDADHDCADVSALTTAKIRSYPDSDILLASPECTNHSLAKGAQRRKPQAASLWEDGPAGDAEQDRSRATMWDVPRFAEAKMLKGKPYKAIVVENVVDAFRWGANDDGGLFAGWRQVMHNLGYESEIVWLNSMFAPPTPQSRDRMYVVFWLKGIRRPDLRIEPPSWCVHCEKIVDGRQAWKRPQRPLETAQGKPVGARYGVQYLFTCPDCHSVVLPGVYPAATAIDWTVPAPRIGDRAKPLAKNTRERIRRGLERLAAEPFAIRLMQGGVPRPLTLPIVTLTARHDMAMVMPVIGNTFERTPGNRARDAATQPGHTVHGTLDRALVVAYSENGNPRTATLEAAQTQRTNPTLALVMANTENGVPRDAERESAQTLRTEGGLAIVGLQRNGDVRDAEVDVAHTMRAGGFHHGLIVRNNNSRGDSGAMGTPPHEPFRTLTAACHQSLLVPYGSEAGDPGYEAAPTITTRDRLALIVPPMGDVTPRDATTEPLPTQTTTTRAGIVTEAA